MFKELIDKLKQRRNKIQNYRTNNDEIKTGIKVHEEKEVEIIISSQNNITKIEIPDYVCIGDFVDKELITEVENNNQDNLIIKAKTLKDFNSISNKRYEELKNIAQTWLSLTNQKYNSKVAAYSITNQNKLLGLTNLTEQITLFILLIDSDLDMLKIYEEESTQEKIKERIIEQFGYFDKELLILERKFHDRFCPNKKLSIWSYTKKR